MAQKELRSPWYQRIRGFRFYVAFVALLGLLATIGTATDAIDQIAIFLGVKPNALQLSEDDERARFSREFTRAAWQRLFLMRRYVLAVKNNYQEAEQEKEWSAYSVALTEWNRDLMVNILSFEQHYGNEKRKDFEQSIQPAFGKLHTCIEGIKRPSSNVPCLLSASRKIAVIENRNRSA
jgi:hypothetical protein